MDAMATIREIRKMRSRYEDEIASAIAPILRRFEDESGLNALGLSVYMMEVTRMQDERPRYMVERVSMEVDSI